ncbi:hypothetical protein K505DRAFT_377401 [Melanomma pulvis-pyrius CBS 109.77]|uniref:Uncharacterized protein n=1 Tax=Melanomma pulvis-pyrius CBS 109.77 TaxID=1314802 RepID=A0A6A6X3C5_9PLEO|nr:hypothetical protein K505DRAFT_377401 [Melanomma pulvis-pyrius CBS 109.77]
MQRPPRSRRMSWDPDEGPSVRTSLGNCRKDSFNTPEDFQQLQQDVYFRIGEFSAQDITTHPFMDNYSQKDMQEAILQSLAFNLDPRPGSSSTGEREHQEEHQQAAQKAHEGGAWHEEKPQEGMNYTATSGSRSRRYLRKRVAGLVNHYGSLNSPVRTLLDRLGLAHRGKHSNGKPTAPGQLATTASDPSKPSNNGGTWYMKAGKKMHEGKVDGFKVKARMAFEVDMGLEERQYLLDPGDTQEWEDEIAWQTQNLDKHPSYLRK